MAKGYREDGTPSNYGGSYESYLESKSTERERKEANLEHNLGSNWGDIYDLDNDSYHPGKSVSDTNGGRLGIYNNTGRDIGDRYSYESNGGSSGGSGSSGGGGGSSGNGGGSSSGNNNSLKKNLLKEAYDKSVLDRNSSYESGKSQLEQGFLEKARNAYVSRRKSESGVAESVSASGLTGGANNERRVMLERSYDDALSRIQKERAAELASSQQKRDSDLEAYRLKYEKDLLAFK